MASPSAPFAVKLTREAKELFARLVSTQGYTKPGLMVHRQGPIGEVVRSVDGKAVWTVERSHPWKVRVGELETIPETAEAVVVVEGIRVWLPLIPRPGERGVEISVRDGELVADTMVAAS